LFGCTPLLGQADDAMGFDPARLDALLVGHESEIARAGDLAAEGYIREMNARPLATELQRLLVRLLPSGEATLEELARRMNRGVSTLQRQLQEEGIGYREVLEATRRALAEGYLADERLSLGEIAYLLGFADQSSFTRAFHRWAGMSPRRFRERRGPAGGLPTPPA
jgi:AraC-like DNA-binding protein